MRLQSDLGAHYFAVLNLADNLHRVNMVHASIKDFGKWFDPQLQENPLITIKREVRKAPVQECVINFLFKI